MITIITVVLNDAEGAARTIASLKPLKNRINHHILVDGLSSDGTLKILHDYKYNSSYPVYILSERDQGIYDAMNKGLNIIQENGLSDGYIWFLNAGDLYFNCENSFEYNFNEDLIFFKALVQSKYGCYTVPKNNDENFYKNITPIHQAVLFKSSALVGLRYDLSFKVQADTKLIYELINKGFSLKFIPVELCVFYLGGYSSEYSNYVKCIRQFSEQVFIMVSLNGKGMRFVIFQIFYFIIKYLLTKLSGDLFQAIHYLILRVKNRIGL